jgi:hypothetical protein
MSNTLLESLQPMDVNTSFDEELPEEDDDRPRVC